MATKCQSNIEGSTWVKTKCDTATLKVVETCPTWAFIETVESDVKVL